MPFCSPGGDSPAWNTTLITAVREDVATEEERRDPGVWLLSPTAFATERAARPASGPFGPLESQAGFTVEDIVSSDDERMVLAGYRVTKRPWGDWWGEMRDGYDITTVDTVALPIAQPPTAREGGGAPIGTEDIWDNGILNSLPDGRGEHTAVWTGTEMIVWGGRQDEFVYDDGGRYDPLTNTWRRIQGSGAPSPRVAHTAIWTGDRMVVWGGWDVTYLGDGASYDPMLDAWSPVSSSGAPVPLVKHTAVWSGTEMIVYGRTNMAPSEPHASRYDPQADTWTPASSVNIPPIRTGHTAVWTGAEMIIWGGGPYTNDGGRYDPTTDQWTPTTLSGVFLPSPREEHSAVWTGTEMLIWAGLGLSGPTNTGGRYNPASDSWEFLGAPGNIEPRHDHEAVWTGSQMLVWGGPSSPRYDPLTGSWSTMSLVNAPEAHSKHSLIWTGTQMIVWGGGAGVNAGGRYDPAADIWTPTGQEGAPAPRHFHTAVWSGTEMIVWGGTQQPEALDSGGRYDPLTDSWAGVSSTGAPTPRINHTAVWTGDGMLVWGGSDNVWPYQRLNTGAFYDPIVDQWTATSVVGAPSVRENHSAVWSATEMIVWGGQDANTRLADGARYSPPADTWTPMSPVEAPVPRAEHAAVWTGTQMIVWGGVVATGTLDTGGVYEPATDSWTPTTLTDAPLRRQAPAIWDGTEMVFWGVDMAALQPPPGAAYDPAGDSWSPVTATGQPETRRDHTLAWTGETMVAWGGLGMVSLELQQGGGRYDPILDAWSSMSLDGAPLQRQDHTAVWTGRFVIVWGGRSDNGSLNSGGRYVPHSPADGDGDGFPGDVDCDDMDPDIHPGAPEICDGIDNDCSGLIDDAAEIIVEAVIKDLTPGTPGIVMTPFVGLTVGAFDKSIGSCADQVCGNGVAWHCHADVVAQCQPLVERVTNVDGNATLLVPEGNYLIIGDDGTDKHLAVPSGELLCGDSAEVFFQRIVR